MARKKDAERQLVNLNDVITGAMKAGAIDYLSKPFRDEDLLRAVEQALVRASDRSVKRCGPGSQR
jgi:FixJ family two-component response regulator